MLKKNRRFGTGGRPLGEGAKKILVGFWPFPNGGGGVSNKELKNKLLFRKSIFQKPVNQLGTHIALKLARLGQFMAIIEAIIKANNKIILRWDHV